MDINLFLILAFCMAGSNFFAWRGGRQEGINHTVQYLIDEGILEVAEE